MSRLARILRFAAAALCLSSTPIAGAQTYPAQPVRVVVPYSAGSGPDAMVRQVGERVARDWAQPVVVDNKPGANGWLAIGEVKRAKADGYTLLTVAATHMALQPNLYKQLPFDPVRDFEPVTGLYATHFFVVVAANAPWKSVRELVAAARAKQGTMTYATWGMGSEAHVGAAQLEASTGTKMTHVPFKDIPQLYASVAKGEVDWAFGTAATVGPLVQAGRLRLLAYAAPKRLAGHEAVPTVAESGGPAGFALRTWVALYAPAGTPPAVVNRIHTAVSIALNDAELRQRMAAFGFEPWGVAADALRREADADTVRYADVTQRAAIQLD